MAEAPSPAREGARASGEPAVEARRRGNQQQQQRWPAALEPPAIGRRLQGYGRELALLLLSGNLRAARLAAAALLHAWRWALTLPAAHAHRFERPAALLALWRRVLAALLRPLGRLVAQLVSVQLRLVANDVGDLDSATKLSVRLHSCLTLLFGTIRWRSHSCVQLALPSRQPLLLPEISVCSPSTSPSQHRGARRSQAGAGAGQQQQRQQHPQQQLRLSTGSASSSSPSRRHSGARQPVGGAVADSEVHVLCSSELRAAILAFLQHHSSNREYVLLRSNSSSWGGTGGGSAPWERSKPGTLGSEDGAQEGAAAAAGAEPAPANQAAAQRRLASAGGRIRQSRQLFEALAVADSGGSGSSTPRLARSLNHPLGGSSGSGGVDRAWSVRPPHSPQHHRVPSQAAGLPGLAWGAAAGLRGSWPGPAPAAGAGAGVAEGEGQGEGGGWQAVAADAVAAVSVEEPQDGVSSPTFGLGQAAAAAASAAGSPLRPQRHRPGSMCASSCASDAFADLQMAPLISFPSSSRARGCADATTTSSSGGGWAAAAASSSEAEPRGGCCGEGGRQQQHQHQHQHQQWQGEPSDELLMLQQQQQQLASQRSWPVSPYIAPRSVSPIGAPARHGVRTKRLPAAPFRLSAQQPA